MNIKTLLGSIFVLFLLVATAYSQPIKNAVPDVARPLPLSSVRLTGGPLKRAQELNADYLLKLEPDRMMAYYRKRAGLEPRAQGYPGWDGDGRNLTGHIAGHYLSAVSLMFAATGDPRFKQRADYIVKEMKEVQDKNGDGYLGAVEGLYVPSTATWKEAGATVAMDTTFPDGDAATLKRVNGKSVTALPGPGSYVELKRTWKTGDTVSLVLLNTLRIEGLADNPDLDYKIPAELVKDTKKVTVRFQATGGNETATVFGICIVRADKR